MEINAHDHLPTYFLALQGKYGRACIHIYMFEAALRMLLALLQRQGQQLELWQQPTHKEKYICTVHMYAPQHTAHHNEMYVHIWSRGSLPSELQ